MQPKKTLCPIRKMMIYVERKNSDLNRFETSTEGDDGEEFAPCIQGDCAWWMWVDEVGGNGGCAISFIARGTNI